MSAWSACTGTIRPASSRYLASDGRRLRRPLSYGARLQPAEAGAMLRRAAGRAAG